MTLPIRSRALLALLCAAALTLPGCKKGGGDEAKPEETEHAAVVVDSALAELRDMEATVSAPGTIAPAQGASARVAPQTAGRLVRVNVREGDVVRAGQVLAELDDRVVRAGSRSAAAALTAAEAQARQASIGAQATAVDQVNAVRVARLALDAARADRDGSVQAARTALQAADTDLRKARAGSRPQEIAQADQAVAQAKATRDRAAMEIERVRLLFDKGVAAKRQLDDALTALTVASAALEGAKQQASMVRAGNRPEDVRAAEIRDQQAREALAQAEKGGAVKVRQAEAALQQAEQSALQVAAKRQEAVAMRDLAAQKRADAAAARSTADLTVLRAPIGGVVTRRNGNPGDMADPAAPVVEIANSSALELVANVVAEEGLKVKPGLSARITTASEPGHTYAGRVLSVGQVDPQTNLLTIRVMVDASVGRLKVGTYATAEIVVRKALGAVAVPHEALLAREDKTVVFVVGVDSVAHEREVKTGTEQGGAVEILAGVKAGDRVVRLGHYELSDGSKVEIAKPGEKVEGKKAGEKDEKP